MRMPRLAQKASALAAVRVVAATKRITSLAWTLKTRCCPHVPSPTIAARKGVRPILFGSAVNLHRIRRGLRPIVHDVVAKHARDAQPVGLEDAAAALRLRFKM